MKNLQERPKRHPFISVVIPAFNEEKYLRRCLEALKKQDYKNNFEIIVVDNNSKDRTSSIAREFGVRVILEKKQGNTFALERGMMEAKGDIIAATDADSQVRPDWLSIIKKAFENSDIAAVTGVVRLDSKSRIKRISLSALYAIFINITTFIGKPNIAGFNFAVRKDAFLKVGGIDTKFVMSPDVDLGIRLERVGKVSVINNLSVLTSARRWEEGFVPTLWEYARGYIYTVWLRKPPKVKQAVIR